MLRLNRQTDYAIRVLLALAEHPPGTRLSSSKIGQEMLIPPAFMKRIVSQLAQAGFVKTFPGREGGLELARQVEQITLRGVVEFMEGPLLLSECMNGKKDCPFEDNCRVQQRWADLQEVILAELEATNIAQLAQETKQIRLRS